MVRTSALLLAACFVAASCGAQQASAPDIRSETPVAIAQSGAEEETPVATGFEGICRITMGQHIAAPEGGNRSTSSANGTKITVLGSKSQSMSSVNGRAVVTVTGAAMVHVTFPGDEDALASVEVSPDADRVEISIDGPNNITCKQVG